MVKFAYTDLMRAADMRRLCLVMVAIAGTATATTALAQTKIARHASRTAMDERVVAKNDALALNNLYSDSFAPTAHSRWGASSQFPPVRAHPPVEPEGGFSIRAGRDNPGEPMTGGLKFRF